MNIKTNLNIINGLILTMFLSLISSTSFANSAIDAHNAALQNYKASLSDNKAVEPADNNQKTEPKPQNKLSLKGVVPGNIYTERNLNDAFGPSCGKTFSGEPMGCTVLSCRDVGGLDYCSGTINLGNVKASMMAELSPQNELMFMSFSFPANDFKYIEPILIEKFGKPETEESTVTTRMGVNYDQVKHYWESEELRASIDKYGQTVEESVLLIYHPALIKKYTKPKITSKDLD